jgi:hypothetical protein
MATRLSQAKPWQFYEDFLSCPVWPTPANPDDQTDGRWIAFNTGHNLEVPNSVPAAEAGHPGLQKFSFKTDGDATQTVQVRVGQKAQLKDWARFGATCKATYSSDTCGFYFGFGDDSAPTEVVFFYDYKPVGASHVAIAAGVDLGAQYNEIGNEDYDYGVETAIQHDLLKEDWHTYEIEVDYPSRTITFYIDGARHGQLSVPEEAAWETELRPFFQLKYPRAESITFDEVGFSTASFLTANTTPEAEITASRTLRPGTTRTDNK